MPKSKKPPIVLELQLEGIIFAGTVSRCDDILYRLTESLDALFNEYTLSQRVTVRKKGKYPEKSNA